MNFRNLCTKALALLGAGAIATLTAGCAVATMPASGGWGPPPNAMVTTADGKKIADPRVQDCGIVAIGSPTKYACHGKVYTSIQLSEMTQKASAAAN